MMASRGMGAIAPSKMPKGKTIIHATLDPAHLNKDVVSDVGLVGDAKLTLQALIGELRQTIKSNRDGSKVAAEIVAVRDEWMKQWAPLLNSNDAPLNPYRVIRDLMAGVDVYKNPSAKMIEGGVGGTVSVTTRKPLDFKKPTLSFTGSMQNLDTVDVENRLSQRGREADIRSVHIGGDRCFLVTPDILLADPTDDRRDISTATRGS